MKSFNEKTRVILQALLLIVAPVLVSVRGASAAQLTTRSVTVSSALPSATVSEVFGFNIPTTGTIGSIEFEHCSNDPLVGTPCTAPTGLNLSSVVLTSQTNNTGFSIDIVHSTSNRIVLTRTASAGTIGLSKYTFTGATNPSTAGQTTFVRIATFASTDGTGARTDTGSVAYATESKFSVGAFVPPFLTLCAGVTVALDCSSTNGQLIDFGELSTTQTKTGTSQFSGATNDPTGYSVFINGQTMTAGNQIIQPLDTNSPSIAGTGQFGINLRANTVPVVGSEPSGVGTCLPVAQYGTTNSYRFVSGELLASSSNSTNYNRYTVSYVVNIHTGQAPGYYATTLTYLATASF